MPLNDKLQQVFGDHVEDNRQQDDVDVDCYEEDQAGIDTTSVWQSLASIEVDEKNNQ